MALTNTILVSHTVGVTVTAGNTVTLEGTLWGSGDWANGFDWGGDGTIVTRTVNLWSDPAFVNPAGGDYHIGAGSKAVDAGVPSGVTTDTDGDPRPAAVGFDLGADERPGISLHLVKQPSAVFLNPGQMLTYTIIVTSAGTGDATGVVLTDALDGWQRAKHIEPAAICTIADAGWGGTAICSPGTMASGTTAVVTLVAEVSTAVPARQAMVNTVAATADETANSVRITTYGQDCHARVNDAPTEYTTVQAAVDAAGPGDLVKVAGVCVGASKREDLRQQVYLDKSLTIRGGYTTTDWTTYDPDANPTTLDALGQGRVLYITGDIAPTVEGLRLTGGDAYRLGGGSLLGDAGGGVYGINTSATIRDNQVFGNAAEGGGGLYLSGGAAALSRNTVYANAAEGGGGLFLGGGLATLISNTVSANYARSDGGGLVLDGSPATLSGNTVISNVANENGGGLYLHDSHATLNSNTVSANTADHGGGLYLVQSNATLSGNTISGNSARSGGGGLYTWQNAPQVGGNVTLSDNTISANFADKGGGLVLDSLNATLTNNVIADNQVDVTGSGIYVYCSLPRLWHTTIARNHGGDGSGVYVADAGSDHRTVALTNTILVSHTVGVTVTAGNTVTLEGTLWGSGAWANGADWGGDGTVITGTVNVRGDPGFIDPDTGDYHIIAASAAVDEGVIAPEVTTDIDGQSRPYGDGYDIGADEFYPSAGLVVSKQASRDPVPSGAPLIYTIQVTNTGDVTLTATITDVLPNHVTTTQPLIWGPVVISAPGGTWTETVPVIVVRGYAGLLTNVVQVTTDQDATGTASVTVRAVRRIFLPLVMRNYAP